MSDWFEQLITAYRTNAARMFVLHFNINDYVLNKELTPPHVTRIIPRLQAFGRTNANPPFSAIFRYSNAMPTSIGDQVDVELAALEEEATQADQLTIMRVPQANNATAADIFNKEWREVVDLPEPEKILRTFERILRSRQQRSMVFIEHVEHIAPQRDAETIQPDQLVAIEILRRLTGDFAFRSSSNMCVLITRDLNSIDSSIYAPGSNCVPIQVPLPNLEQRRTFLQLMHDRRPLPVATGGVLPIARRQISALADFDEEIRENAQHLQAQAGSRPEIELLAGLTEGFRLVEIDQLNRQVLAKGAASDDRRQLLTLTTIKQHKRRAIEEQSGGLLDVVDVERGFDAIGGMEVVKNYLRSVSRAVRTATTDPTVLPLVPRGIILAGPPGTGKTIIAEALARESALNMVKLRSVRQQFVGSSERNLRRVFDLISALSPILVFVDEIDQAFGSRGVGASSDGGTSERMFGMILEFIGDDRNRGRVIWVAATNRPDSLDAALLRRFDRIIPCLLPTAAEQVAILAALPKTIKRLAFSVELQELITRRDNQVLHLFEAREGMVPTGAVIESIARRAVEIAGTRSPDRRDVTLNDLQLAVNDYRSNANRTEYDFQSLLAIHACNFYSVMPELPDREPFKQLVQKRPSISELVEHGEQMIPEYWQQHLIVYSRLEQAIREHQGQLYRR